MEKFLELWTVDADCSLLARWYHVLHIVQGIVFTLLASFYRKFGLIYCRPMEIRYNGNKTSIRKNSRIQW